jgi:predicted ester cyclase
MKSNKDIIIDYSKAVWGERNLSVIDQVVASNAQIHSPLNTLQGSETMHAIVEKWLTAFPDLSITWEEFIAEGNRVVSRWSAIGTHLGGFFDTKPTYREVRYSGVTIYHLEKGKIVDYRAFVDIHAILSQLEEYDSIESALES